MENNIVEPPTKPQNKYKGDSINLNNENRK